VTQRTQYCAGAMSIFETFDRGYTVRIRKKKAAIARGLVV
jgi:hypothetical protein